MCPSRPDDDLGRDIRLRLNQVLSRALKNRDAIAVSALRSALGAIGNAEAPDAGTASPPPPAARILRALRPGLALARLSDAA
jgi:hypothetical protein